MAAFYSEYAADAFLSYCLPFAIISGPLLGLLEYKGGGLRYSKFATGGRLIGQIPSKLAMFFYYAPAMFLAAAVLSFKTLGYPNLQAFLSPKASFRYIVLNTALFVHFFKRTLEVLLLHKYSGNAELLSSIVIVFFYTFFTGNLLYAQEVSDRLAQPVVNLLWIGVLLFLIGIAGNFYHHYLLAQLRSSGDPKQKQRYRVPHGGLFNLVACPHYLFEIIDFLGLALISQTSTGLSSFFLVAVYLTCRSLSTRKWYLKKVEGFPRNRKAILPFII